MSDIKGPMTKYKMMWGGEWRPVVNMLDPNNRPTTMPLRATRAVVFVHEGPGYEATVCTVAEIFEREDREPAQTEWEPTYDRTDTSLAEIARRESGVAPAPNAGTTVILKARP